jgi:phage baseplate assembly protein V
MSTAARARCTEQRYYGVVVAIVTDNIDPASEGRVKIQFPWFDEQMETEWCRVSQFYSGNGFGAFFIPEVGDEVLVSFIHGDMRMPIVIGGLYNGKDKPPSSRQKDKDEKMIRTKGGHRIILDDTQGKEKIVIIDSKGNNSVEIDTKGDSITIKAATGKLVLDAQGIEIKSGKGFEVSAQTTVKIEANSTMDLKGSTININ